MLDAYKDTVLCKRCFGNACCALPSTAFKTIKTHRVLYHHAVRAWVGDQNRISFELGFVNKSEHRTLHKPLVNTNRSTPDARKYPWFWNNHNQFVARLPIWGKKDARPGRRMQRCTRATRAFLMREHRVRPQRRDEKDKKVTHLGILTSTML